jgi:hypothetical protein
MPMMNQARGTALEAGKARVDQEATAPKPAGFYPGAAPGGAPAQQAQAPAEPPQQIERDTTVSGVAAQARKLTGRMSGPVTAQEPASEEEQAEYERALDALSRVIYEDDNTSKAVVDGLQPEDKVGSVANLALILVQQLDDKIDMDEAVIPQMTLEIVDRLVDLGEQTKQMQFSDEDVQNALGAAWEGVMNAYGLGEAQDFEEITQGMGDEELQAQTSAYKQFLGGDF